MPPPSCSSYADMCRISLFCLAAAPITLVDLRERCIPDALSLGGLFALAAWDAAVQPRVIPMEAAAAALGFALFWALRLATRGLGFGDVKYAALIGFFVGLRYWFVAIFVAALGALLYWVFAVYRLRRPPRERIAFAPFLTLGAMAACALRIAGQSL